MTIPVWLRVAVMVKVMVVLPWLGLIMTVEAVNWLKIIFHLLFFYSAGLDIIVSPS